MLGEAPGEGGAEVELALEELDGPGVLEADGGPGLLPGDGALPGEGVLAAVGVLGAGLSDDGEPEGGAAEGGSGAGVFEAVGVDCEGEDASSVAV